MSFPAVAPCQRTAVTQADHCRPGAPNTLRSQSYTWRRLVSMDIIGEKAVAEPTMARATARASMLLSTLTMSLLSLSKAKAKAVTNFHWFFRQIPSVRPSFAGPLSCHLQYCLLSGFTTFHAFLALLALTLQFQFHGSDPTSTKRLNLQQVCE